jgi:23S rRNA (pseudouridine1915-N3)-methyltransferase
VQIRILAVGGRMPAWVEAGCDEYLKRFSRDFPVSLQPVEAAGRGRSRPAADAMRREGEALLARVGAADRCVALAVDGVAISTPQLAQRIEDWRMDGRDVSLLIGGADGLASACLDRAEWRWSLSKLTLPHPLVRVLLLEQLYRAWSIISGHPYHR